MAAIQSGHQRSGQISATNDTAFDAGMRLLQRDIASDFAANKTQRCPHLCRSGCERTSGTGIHNAGLAEQATPIAVVVTGGQGRDVRWEMKQPITYASYNFSLSHLK